MQVVTAVGILARLPVWKALSPGGRTRQSTGRLLVAATAARDQIVAARSASDGLTSPEAAEAIRMCTSDHADFQARGIQPRVLPKALRDDLIASCELGGPGVSRRDMLKLGLELLGTAAPDGRWPRSR